jgi:hypothetical protein
MAPRTTKPKAGKRVTCNTCMKEVPKSAAVVPEAMDYVTHFCGLPCYNQWIREVRLQDSNDMRRAVEDGMKDLRAGRP